MDRQTEIAPDTSQGTERARLDEKKVLLLQGGGALGAYQGGVYEELEAHGIIPDWVAGISIGAINAAIIAGNAAETRVERLRAFWEGITTPWPWPVWTGFDGHRRASCFNALVFRQPGFFSPRPPTQARAGTSRRGRRRRRAPAGTSRPRVPAGASHRRAPAAALVV